MRLFEIDADTAHVTNKFNITAIDNRRFMYNAKLRKFILGDAAGAGKSRNSIQGSHAEEYYNVFQTNKGFDTYVRGWIGANKTRYKNGIVHFAPPIPPQNVDQWGLYEAGYKTLEFLLKNGGANAKTIVVGWENSMAEIPIGQIIPEAK